MKSDFIQMGLLCLIVCLACPDLIGQTAVRPDRMRLINPNLPHPIPIDFEQVDANGIRVLESDHLLLLTDIRDRADIDELTSVFDAAVDQWCRYFDIDRERADAWKLRGMVIVDREKFNRAELIPDDLPDFPAGFQRGHEMWVYLQRGKYYTRHLLLHEGTHSFMQWFLKGTGAPWYSEGMAELLGVHRWLDGQLTLNHQLRDRSEAEYWGRIKLIQQDCAAGRALSIADVLYFAPEVFRDVRYYAWSWAACEFLSRHPLSKHKFAKLQVNAHLEPRRFNRKFEQSIAPVRAELERDWNLFINEIDFGYDIDRGRLRTITAESAATDNFRIDAGFSWQATPLSVRAGERFRFIGAGRFTVANESGNDWPCEAGGVTIEYYRGNPLGQLAVGVLGADGEITGLLKPRMAGLGRVLQFDSPGTICLRINESPSRLGDNRGHLDVSITPVSEDDDE